MKVKEDVRGKGLRIRQFGQAQQIEQMAQVEAMQEFASIEAVCMQEPEQNIQMETASLAQLGQEGHDAFEEQSRLLSVRLQEQQAYDQHMEKHIEDMQHAAMNMRRSAKTKIFH